MEKLLKYLRVVIKYRKLIFYDVLIFTLLAVVLSFILPKKYLATARLLPPPEESEFAGLIGTTGTSLSIPRISSRLARGAGFLRGSTPSDLIGAILLSRTIQERVVTNCDLMRIYKIKKSMEVAVKRLNRETKVKITEEGVVEINVETQDAKLAADIANSYLEELDRFLKESNMSRGKNMRLFIEKRLNSALTELKTAQESLQTFQERHKVVALDEETKAVIDAYAKLKSELLKREMEMALIQNVSASDNVYLSSVKKEIFAFQQKLKEMEGGKSRGRGFGAGFAVPFSQLPAVAAEYARRLRDYRVQEEIYALLVQQYEQAKIMEARDTPTITVLDYARIPEKKSFPKRAIIVFVVFLFSLVGGIGYTFFIEYVESLRSQKPEEYKEWQGFLKTVKNDFSFLFKKKMPESKQG